MSLDNNETNQGDKFVKYYFSRALSAFGDEVWLVAVPIYFATANYPVLELGFVSSLTAIGTVFGFLLLPAMVSNLRINKLTIWIDIFQALTFLLFGGLLVRGENLPISVFGGFAFLVAFFGAVWFGSSEALAAKITTNSNAQTFHKFNYFASNAGPILAPLVASNMTMMWGLGVLGILNAVSFIPQIFALRGMNRLFSASVNEIDRKGNNSFSFFQLMKHPHFGPLIIISILVKVTLVGALPFIAYVVAHTDLAFNKVLLSSVIAAFPAGSLVGAFTYRSKDLELLAQNFFNDTLFMFVSIAGLLFSLTNKIPIALGVFSFLGGFFSARYTIEIRAMRQLITSPNTIAKLISLQGLVARVLTPTSGILFGFLLSSNQAPIYTSTLGLLLPILAAPLIIKSRNGFIASSTGGDKA